ncbi:LacI family DNA-binding transcriptional regulator [Enterocloster sp. OA13]|uniref:LacI family DNA-binding transcriptional regulator n=1 Tax=Enterocloster sp. OA13 TaxID=2914161 RepID=UPI000471C800|nr:LacI family DNA-binding transcriptional regulator [Enterocloster sp. OA13]
MTNREIAKLLDISPATLSLIINNKPGISTSTRANVLEKLHQLGYSDLIKKEISPPASDNICFVVYKRHGGILDSSPFFLLIMESIESCAHKYGYNILFNSIDKRNPLKPQMRMLNSMDCRGAVIFATEMLEDDISVFSELNFPYVILDNDFPFKNLDSVAINNTLGTFQAVEHLVSMGHTKIGYLQSCIYINSFGERETGFSNALKQFGLKLNSDYIFRLDYSEEGSYRDFKHIISTGRELPTAFFTDDDTIAAGAMKAMFEAGISVPGDVSLIGYNDRPVCSVSSPPLSSIRVPRYSFSAMAIDLLVSRIEHDRGECDAIPSYKYRIGTELVTRASVRSLV